MWCEPPAHQPNCRSSSLDICAPAQCPFASLACANANRLRLLRGLCVVCASFEMNAATVSSQVVKTPLASTCDVVPISANGVRVSLYRSETRSLCVNQIRAHEVIGQKSQQKALKISQVESSTTCSVLLRELCGNRLQRFEIVRDNFQHCTLEFIAIL